MSKLTGFEPVFGALISYAQDTVVKPDVSFAPDVTHYTDLANLVDIAHTITGYDIPTEPKLPKVEYVTADEMSTRQCHGSPRCGVFAYYGDDNIIVIRGDLYPEFHDGILIHEVTHWLQDHSHRYSKDKCWDINRREMEAYAVQNVFIQKAFHGLEFIVPTMGVLCKIRSS